jgi:hypothetical protein
LLQVICTDLEFAYILPFVLNRDAIRDDTKFAEILDGIGGSESVLAYLLVQQINNTVASPITSATTLALDSVMQLLNARATPALRAGMLIHGGAKAVIDAIYFAEEARPRFPRAGEGVYLTAIFLSGSFESEAGAEWVSKALSAGLLKLIVTLDRVRVFTERRRRGLDLHPPQHRLVQSQPQVGLLCGGASATGAAHARCGRHPLARRSANSRCAYEEPGAHVSHVVDTRTT